MCCVWRLPSPVSDDVRDTVRENKLASFGEMPYHIQFSEYISKEKAPVANLKASCVHEISGILDNNTASIVFISCAAENMYWSLKHG